MINRQTIEYILDRCSIADVIRGYVPELKKAGTTYKACCPFHSERTPSFTVFPNTATFKCFGCGEQGNVIQFVMKHERLSFPEAVRELAKSHNIEIEESQQTDKEVQEYRTKEAMWAANERLMRIYEQQLPLNAKAREYAYNRWGEEFCKIRSVGFCPRGAMLVDKAKVSEEICTQLGLKNKGEYDFFNGRIVIPIRDRQNHVIGFTARVMDDSEPKYMNSRESLIYSKARSVFGIDMAWREATKKEAFYLVEGAPDCMRLQSIGVLNTVAPLGTAWTEEQFALLKRAASKLCFLPDADPPKGDDRFGAGIAAVMKAGEMAIKAGFSVTVKQIPVTNEKQDPDSYCISRMKFKELDEVSFVEWMAQWLFTEGMSTEEEAKVIDHIAAIMAYIKDDTIIDRYATKLTRFVKDKRMWKKQVEKQKNLIEQEELKLKEQNETHLYRTYGFNVSDKNYYYSYNEQSGIFIWSNFILTPLFHIKDNINPKRLYTIKNMKGTEELIELKQEELVGINKFKVKVEGMGDFLWKAGSIELDKLKAYLYANTKTAIEVKQLGWQPKQRVYAFGNGIFDGKMFHKVDEYGIVPVEQGYLYLPSHSKIYIDDRKLFDFEKRFVHLGLSAVKMREFTDLLFTVFGNNGRVGFLFVLATIFRDIVTWDSKKFPILNLFGPKGTGKTEMGQILTSFFIMDNTPVSFKNATIPAMSETVASAANACVHLDEYKNDLDVHIIEFLKGLWDGTGRSRLNMDLDKKREVTFVESGVILSGQEMPTADNALFSRLIFLTFSKSVFSVREQQNFDELNQMRTMGLTHLTIEILKKRDKVEAQYKTMFIQTLNDVNDRVKSARVEDRILKNWVKPLAVFRCLETHLDTSLTYKEMLEIVVEGILYQNSQCRQNNELSRFWDMFNFLKTEGELIEGGDFKVKYVFRLKTNMMNAEWEEPKPILLFHKTRVFDLYRSHGKKQGENILPEGSLKYYLENSSEFLGYKGSYRFKNYIRGIPVMDKSGHQLSGTYAAYCFDYQELKKNYGINLENDGDRDDTDDEVNEAKPGDHKEVDRQTKIDFSAELDKKE